MRRVLTILLPLMILAAGAVAAKLLIDARQAPQTRPPEVEPPLVRCVAAVPEDVTLEVRAHGTVEPRAEIVLRAEVAGRVVALAEAFEVGGAFGAGEALVELDPVDYELALVQAEAAVAEAEARRQREEAEATLAREEWGALGRGEPDPLVVRAPQLAEVRAVLASARARAQQAEVDLRRTRLLAPFDGRVRSTDVDVGQFVTRGERVGALFATDIVEVRLPIPDEELAFLDPALARAPRAAEVGTEVWIEADFAGARRRWRGVLDRVEGELDPDSRMVTLVARVAAPDPASDRETDRETDPASDRALETDLDPLPLPVGLFVEATVTGLRVDDVVVLPRAALRADGRVLVVEPDDRLRAREVTVLRAARERLFVTEGLAAGERVCVSPLEVFVDGMRVRSELVEPGGDRP